MADPLTELVVDQANILLADRDEARAVAKLAWRV